MSPTNVIEALVAALESIPPIPGDAIVQCVAGLAVAVFRVYEQKCANDSKVGDLHLEIARVSAVLDRHLVPQSSMVATYRDQLKDLTDALKAAGEWVVAYARRSTMSKYFSANKERRKAEAKKGAVTSALQALNLAMLSVSSGQLQDVHGQMQDVHAAVVGGLASAAANGNASGLPPGWGESIDPTTGRVFYIDYTNKTTTWERPVDANAPAPTALYPAPFPAAPSAAVVQPVAVQQGGAVQQQIAVAGEPVAMGIPVDDATLRSAPDPAIPMAEQHAFLDAAKFRDYQTMMRMAEASPGLINVMPSGRWSALHQAAEKGDTQAVQWLLARGADPEALTPQGKRPRDVAVGDDCKRLLAAAAPSPPRFSFELGKLGVQAGVALHLQCGNSGTDVLQGGAAPLQCSEHEVRLYVLAGPQAAVADCAKEFGDYDRTKRLGFISPASRVTLDPASRAAAGVPADAAWFAFAHPPTGVAKLSEQQLEELGERGITEPWIHFLTLGGFCYFDNSKAIISANAITDPECGGAEEAGGLSMLRFDEPRTADARVLTALHTQGRMHDVTIPALRAAGAVRYGWLNPSEAAGGVPAPLAEAWDHGAFVYEPAGGGEALLFRVVPADASPSPNASPRSSPDPSATNPTPPQFTRTESEGIADALQVPVTEIRALRAAEAAAILNDH